MLSVFGKSVAMTSWIINFYITSTREMGWEYIGLGTGVIGNRSVEGREGRIMMRTRDRRC